jgi:hypothetical protein
MDLTRGIEEVVGRMFESVVDSDEARAAAARNP